MADHLAHDLSAGRHIAAIHHHNHAQAHVEGAQHLVVRDSASLAHEPEDRWLDPRFSLEPRAEAFGQAPREVAENASSGDVRGALPTHGAERFKVREMGLEQLLSEGTAELGIDLAQRHVLEHLADQREPIGVEPARRQADDDIACANCVRVLASAHLDQPDDEPCKVVITKRVHARHLCRLPAK